MRNPFVLLFLLAALSRVDASAAPASDSAAIADATELIHAQAGGHRLILLGEMHGTREAPLLTAALAARYASEGPVLVGLELPASLDPAIRAYLVSDGKADARAQLLAAAAWHVPREHNDGRRNLEAIDLIEQVRLLKVQGRDISLLPFDVGVVGASDSQARDKAMAERLRLALSKLPKGRLLSLSGGVHAMLQKPMFEPEFQDPMGSYLRDLEPYSVDIAARGGEFWACFDKHCGPNAAFPYRGDSGPVGDGSYDFRVVLPRFSVARLIE